MATDTDTEVSPEDVIGLPPSEESFNDEAVPVLLELIQNSVGDYVRQQMSNDEPVSLIGFGMELIYQAGVAEGRSRRR
jgi:hypothetical protein